MKIRTPNIKKIEAFVRKVEIRMAANKRELLLQALTAPNLSPVYKDRGTHSPLAMDLKIPKARRQRDPHWSWKSNRRAS